MTHDERKEYFTLLAEELFAEFGMQGWTFKWNRRRTAFGVCKWKPLGGQLFCKYVELSEVLLKVTTDKEAEGTLRHEIAHALDVEERGTTDHGPNWQKWAIKVGAEPVRCRKREREDVIREQNKKASRYLLTCIAGHEYPSFRKVTRQYICLICYKKDGGKKDDPKYHLKQVPNPNYQAA